MNVNPSYRSINDDLEMEFEAIDPSDSSDFIYYSLKVIRFFVILCTIIVVIVSGCISSVSLLIMASAVDDPTSSTGPTNVTHSCDSSLRNHSNPCITNNYIWLWCLLIILIAEEGIGLISHLFSCLKKNHLPNKETVVVVINDFNNLYK